MNPSKVGKGDSHVSEAVKSSLAAVFSGKSGKNAAPEKPNTTTDGDDDVPDVTKEEFDDKKEDILPEKYDDEEDLSKIDPPAKKEEVKSEEPAADPEEQELDKLEPNFVSPKHSTDWKRLKASREKLQKELNEARQKLKEAPEKKTDSVKAEDLEEYKALLKERDEARAALSDIDYENSAEFRDTFRKPVEDAAERINKLMPTNLSAQDEAHLARLAKQALSLAGDRSKEVEYFDLVDKMKEDFFQGTMGNRFASACENFFEKCESLEKARADKERSRKSALEGRSSTLTATAKALEQGLEDEVKTFEELSKEKLAFWNSDKMKDKIKYDEFKKDELPKVKAVLADFARTGKVTPEFRRLLLNGAYGPVYAKERTEASRAIFFLNQTVQQTKRENEKLKQALEKRGVKFGKSSPAVDSGEKKQEEDFKGDIGKSIMSRISKIGA